MVAFEFDKLVAEQFLDSIRNDRDIERLDMWNLHNLYILAGVIGFAIRSHGPTAYAEIDWVQFHPEQREALEEQFLNNVNAGIEFCCHLAQAVEDGEFDDRFESKAGCAVTVDGDGKRNVTFAYGLKRV